MSAAMASTLCNAAQQEVADATHATRPHDEKIGALRVSGGQHIVQGCAAVAPTPRGARA